MWASIGKIFTGGVTDTIGDIAKEWIETDKESAEAKSIFVKTLDPNGKMRKQISSDVTKMYKLYIYIAMILLLAQAFNIGDSHGVNKAIESMVSLFLPITGMFTAIVSASFGVNAMNVSKENK